MTDTKRDDGGQVYPSEQGQDAEGKWNQTYEAGITRRDWLAGLAMQGYIMRFGRELDEDDMVQWAYEDADNLIAEGERDG